MYKLPAALTLLMISGCSSYEHYVREVFDHGVSDGGIGSESDGSAGTVSDMNCGSILKLSIKQPTDSTCKQAASSSPQGVLECYLNATENNANIDKPFIIESERISKSSKVFLDYGIYYKGKTTMSTNTGPRLASVSLAISDGLPSITEQSTILGDTPRWIQREQLLGEAEKNKTVRINGNLHLTGETGFNVMNLTIRFCE